DAERIAVEQHLATCAECSAALTHYRRFYLLAHSPLQLGPPSATVARGAFMPGTGPRVLPRRRGPSPPAPQSYRRRELVAVAAMLVASLVVAGFLAVLSLHFRPLEGHPTPTPSRQVTPTLVPTARPTPAPTISVAKLPPPGSGYTNSGPTWAQA